MRRRVTKSDRVPVGPRASHPGSAVVAIRSADVFDDNGLLKRAFHPFADDPSNQISGAARRERDNHGYWACRIGLRPRDPPRGWHRRNTLSKLQECAAGKFLDALFSSRVAIWRTSALRLTARAPIPRAMSTHM